MAWSGAMKKVALFITTVVEERLAEEKAGLSPSKTHVGVNTCSKAPIIMKRSDRLHPMDY